MANFDIQRAKNFQKIRAGQSFQNGLFSKLSGLAWVIAILSLLLVAYSQFQSIVTLANISFLLVAISMGYLFIYFFFKK